ncbi:hypothetical protein CWB90_24040, partial [Pseudoalteromonas piscicida]
VAEEARRAGMAIADGTQHEQREQARRQQHGDADAGPAAIAGRLLIIEHRAAEQYPHHGEGHGVEGARVQNAE